MEKKAIFLGVTTFHSNDKDKDYRQLHFGYPIKKDDGGYLRGGPVSVFTPVESKLGDDIKVGSVVAPIYDFDGRRAELVDIKVIKSTPYTAKDFE